MTSTSEPSGLKSWSTSREDTAVRWAPARCTTWPTGCTSSATSTRSTLPPWIRSARRDTAGGVAPFPSRGSRWGWSRAGWGPCGAEQPHKFTSWRLSWDGHEWDCEEIGRKAGELHRVKFSKCLRLPPSTVQNIFLDTGTESEPDLMHWAFAGSLSLTTQWCRRCRQAQRTHSHWMAKCGANSRCCSWLGRGRRRVLVCRGVKKNGHVLCLKAGNHLLCDFQHFFPQSQDFDKCCPLRIIPTCSKSSALFYWDLKSYKASGKLIMSQHHTGRL